MNGLLASVDVGRPLLLILLILLLPWAIAAWPRSGRGAPHPRGAALRSAAGLRAIGAVLLGVPMVLRALALAALVLALADPQWVSTVRTVETSGRGLALAVDLSSSMLARDLEGGEARIEAARASAIRFAQARTLDEQTVVGFAAEAVTRIPRTPDPFLAVEGIRSLDTQLVRDGTDLSAALLLASAELLESALTPRVIVLLTDGAHNGVSLPPLTAARAAAALGIRVHAISLQGEAPTLPVSAAARSAGERIAAEMRTVLQGIAEITGGTYAHAPDPATLDSIYAEIDRIEAPVDRVVESESRTPLQGWLLLIGCLCPVLEALLRGSRWGIIP